MTGLRFRLTSGALATKAAVQAAVSMQMSNPKYAAGAALCRAAAESSTAFLDSFVVWVDDTWVTLTKKSKFSNKPAWSLLSMLMARIFQEMVEVRRGAFDAVSSMDSADAALSTCSAVLWTVFRTLDKMDEFVRAKFKDHPAISAKYIKFLALNSGSDTLESSLKTNEAKLDDHLKKFAAVQKNANVGNDNTKNKVSRIKALKQSVKALTEKVKNLK